MLFVASRSAFFVHDRWRVAGSLTCENMRDGGRNCNRTDGFLFTGNETTGVMPKRVLKMDGHSYCASRAVE
jgi:hypothetical protein